MGIGEQVLLESPWTEHQEYYGSQSKHLVLTRTCPQKTEWLSKSPSSPFIY